MPDLTPIPVSAGFGWTAGGAWASFILLLGIIVRQIGPWKKQASDVQQQFVTDVLGRLTKVETLLETERRAHRIEIARIEARAAAQRSLDRHRFSNAESSFDALLLLLESADLPERLLTAITKVREHRLLQRESEKREAAVIHAAEMKAVEKAQQDLDDEEPAFAPAHVS